MKGAAIKNTAKEMSANRARGESKFAKELWQGLRNVGDTVTVRFLEQGEEITSYWMHEYNVGKRFNYVRCLDQDEEGNSIGVACPGCENDFRRTIKGVINVIWRNSPQLKRGEDGKAVKTSNGQYVVEGYKDEVACWMQGITVFEDLVDKDVKYRGLSSRDFSITKKSKGYSIDPVILEEDGNPGDMTEDDHKLAENKYDLDQYYFQVHDYDEANRMLSGGKTPSGGGVTESDVERKASEGSPWNRGERANRFLQG